MRQSQLLVVTLDLVVRNITVGRALQGVSLCHCLNYLRVDDYLNTNFNFEEKARQDGYFR